MHHPTVVDDNHHHLHHHHHCLRGIFKDLRCIADMTVPLPDQVLMQDVIDGGGITSVNDPRGFKSLTAETDDRAEQKREQEKVKIHCQP